MPSTSVSNTYHRSAVGQELVQRASGSRHRLRGRRQHWTLGTEASPSQPQRCRRSPGARSAEAAGRCLGAPRGLCRGAVQRRIGAAGWACYGALASLRRRRQHVCARVRRCACSPLGRMAAALSLRRTLRQVWQPVLCTEQAYSLGPGKDGAGACRGPPPCCRVCVSLELGLPTASLQRGVS